MADEDDASGGSEPPVTSTEDDSLPTTVDVDLISHFERGAPDDGETR